MFCIFCESNTSVANSRAANKTSQVWRRRKCDKCKKIFSTREKPNLSSSLKVKNHAGKIEAFSEDKLFVSIHKCFSHRKDSLKASRALSETVVGKLLPCKGPLESAAIAKITYKTILRVDRSAAVFYKAHLGDRR